MCKFGRIIGYNTVKKALQQTADTLKHRAYYENPGGCTPRGLLLYGQPGAEKKLLTTMGIRKIKNSCKRVPVAL